MDQPEVDMEMEMVGPSLSATARESEAIELNGTFLVRPSLGWTRGDPFRHGAAGSTRLQSQHADAAPPTVDDWPHMELVLDGGNLLPFHFLRTGDRMGRSVVKIQRDDGATGTGFLVAPDVLLTNHHVLPTPDVAATSVAMANYEVSPPNDPAGRAAVSPLDPRLLFVTNNDLDFTFCGVRGLDFLGAIPLDRERMHIAADETVTIIQHPRGRPKEIALRDNRVVQADGVVLQYSCDTEPGSSGSPVFNNQWKPVAIHHASVLTDSPEGRRIAAGSRARYLNEGIRLSAIALWLETAEASDPAHRAQVTRLRALFGGLNAHAGFFGALGRRGHGRSAAEVVAETYKNRDEVLDLGAWDTRMLAESPGGLRGRAADIGRAIADMGLDLWCFSDADPACLDALCEHVWAAHGLSYQAIAVPPAAGSRRGMGVLVRPAKSLAVEPLAAEPGRLPPRVRVRVGRKHGGPAEIQVVPLNAAALTRPEVETAATPALALALALPGAPDWVFLGDAALVLALEGFGLSPTEAEAALVFVANEPRDGAVAFIASDSSPVAQVFVSPNLRPVLDPAGKLAVAVATDRPLPASFLAFAGPLPIALRLSLDSLDPASPSTSGESSPLARIDASPLPRPAASLDALIEQKLRDLLGPVVARIVAESRAEP